MTHEYQMYIGKDTGEAPFDKNPCVIFLYCLLFFRICNFFVDLPLHFSTILRYAQKRAVCSSSSGIDFGTSVDVSYSQLSNDTMHIRVIWAIAVWPKQQTCFIGIAGCWPFAWLTNSQMSRYVNKSNDAQWSCILMMHLSFVLNSC